MEQKKNKTKKKSLRRRNIAKNRKANDLFSHKEDTKKSKIVPWDRKS